MPTIAATQLPDSLAALLLKVQENIYQPVTALHITAWRTAEPVPFSLRESGERKDLTVGTQWSSTLFDCAWMRFYAELPPVLPESTLVARIDINGELAIVDENQIPLRGLTNVKSTFDPMLGGPGKTVWQLPRRMTDSGVVEFWADAAMNDLFGFVKDEGRIALAEVATVREDVRQLYYDLETLRDYLLALPTDTPQIPELLSAFEKTEEQLDLDNPNSIRAAREALAHWFNNTPAAPALTVHAIGHAHLDLAWLWPIRETIRKGARTFASALYNMERYPEYIFGASQPQLFAWMKQHYPPLYKRIKEAVKNGRIELQGTFWVEPDCNIPNGESYIRQILHGRRFFAEEFGIVPEYCWEPDVFGYNGQLPQILVNSGHKYFMTQKLSWNVVNRFPHHSFHWQGIDGSSILTHMLPEETYNGPAAARSLIKIARDYAEQNVSAHALMAFGIGDGGGGPDAEHLERLRRAPHLPDMPAVRIEPAADFFREWEKQADAFPCWQGELYLERHQGTLTTQALVKRNNRQTEIALRELEWAAMLANVLTAAPCPSDELDALWKEALLYQFHDILPGTSIQRVYTECNARYAVMLHRLRQLTDERYHFIAAALAGNDETRVAQAAAALAVNNETCAAPTAAATTESASAGASIAFNSLSWPRGQWHKDTSGNWQQLKIPPMGWALVPSVATPADFSHTVSAQNNCLENEHLRVSFSPEGYIRSITDKHSDHEYLQNDACSNDFVIITDAGDVWDFETDHPSKDVWPYLRRAIQRPVLTSTTAATDGPLAQITQVWHYKNSRICQRISLCAGERQLQFDTEADWQEEGTMLRVRFAASASAKHACFEIPFGHIQRSTLEQTPEQHAQIEVAAQQWVDLSQENAGLALYNDCKYGFRIKGNTIDMALLRSVPYPGAPLINKGDTAQGTQNTFTDIGPHRFRYALRPHSGATDATLLTQEARAFNTPLFFANAAHGTQTGNAAGSGSWFTTDNQSIEIAAVKRAEDNSGWVLRLVNVCDQSTIAKLSTTLPLTSFTAVNLVEDKLPTDVILSSQSADTQSVSLQFRAFEIKTLYCS